MEQVARFAGNFVLGTGDPPGSCSVHLFKWEGSGRRVARGGLHGFVVCLGSHPPTSSLPPRGFRIHICSETPCISDFHPSKYGASLPPLVHGRVLAQDVSVEDLASHYMPAPPPLPPPLLPPTNSGTGGGDDAAQGSVVAAGPRLLNGGAVAVEPELSVASEAADALAAVAVEPELSVGSAAAGAETLPPVAGDVVVAAVAAIPAGGDGVEISRPVLSEAVVLTAAGEPAAPDIIGVESLPPAQGGVGSAAVAAGHAEAWQPAPPDSAIATAAILARSEQAGVSRQTIGLLEFIAFSVARKRRIRLLLPEGEIDITEAFATPLLDATWAVDPFPVLIVPVAGRAVGSRRHWCMAHYGEAGHFMAAVPTGPRHVEGISAVAEGARRGFAVLPTVADGDCGLDALSVVDGEERSLKTRQNLRLEIRRVLAENANRVVWHNVATATQELPQAASDVAELAAAGHQQAAVAGSSASPAGCDAPAAPKAPAGNKQPAVAGSTASAAAGELSVPLRAAAGNLQRQRQEAAMAALDGPGDGRLVPAEVSLGPDDIVASQPLAPDLEAAVRWSTGLPNPTAAFVRRTAACLSESQATGLVLAYIDRGGGALVVCKNVPRSGCARRRLHQTLLHTRLADARVFAAWAAARGTDHKSKDGRRLIRPFLEEASALPLLDQEIRRRRMYLCRCLSLLVSGSAVAEPAGKPATHMKACQGGPVAWFSRRRAQGRQGRPQQAGIVKDLLFQWFCSIRRSVRSRIPSKLVLIKAHSLMDRYVEEHATRCLRADASVVCPKWMSRWRHEFQVSLRTPNRKWSVPRHVLQQRLGITWANIFRVRRCMARCLGYEPVIENFDQSPFHMNEIGSSGAGTMSIRGGGSVALKEGHAATRERWTANTMVTSCTERAAGIPPLQVMFRVEGSGGGCGERILPRLQAAVPQWAPWMSVRVSPSGSYNESDIIDYMQQVLEPPTEERRWRILLVDAYRAQMTDAVRRCAWRMKYVLIVHGGGSTGVSQVNDTDLHQPLKKGYVEMESAEMLDQQRLRPASVPVPRKEDCLAWLAAVWHNPALHAAVAAGFWKTGQANALDGSQDHLLCREAKLFWDELRMWSRRAEVIHDVDVEFDAGRLQWCYESVSHLVAPFPKQGRRFDNFPTDEGSEPGSDVPGDTDSDGDAPGDSDSDADGRGGSDGPAGELAAAGGGTQPAVAGSGVDIAVVAAGLNLSRGEADDVHDSELRLDVLRAVLQQVQAVGQDALAATIINAVHAEERKAHGRKRSSEEVARAMVANHCAEQRDVDGARSIVALAEAEAKRTRRTLKSLRDEHDRVFTARMALQRASTVVECLQAVKTFDAGDLGQGHQKGGSAEHVRNRMQVLDRLRIRFPPLPATQQNDWDWFKANWTKARVAILPDANKGSFGSTFRNIAENLLTALRNGDSAALSKWMAAESRTFLNIPTLRL